MGNTNMTIGEHLGSRENTHAHTNIFMVPGLRMLVDHPPVGIQLRVKPCPGTAVSIIIIGIFNTLTWI